MKCRNVDVVMSAVRLAKGHDRLAGSVQRQGWLRVALGALISDRVDCAAHRWPGAARPPTKAHVFALFLCGDRRRRRIVSPRAENGLRSSDPLLLGH